MRFSTLSALLVTAALAVAPQNIAFAKPASTFVTSTTVAPVPATADADRYAAREAKDIAVTNFEGGRQVLVIGGTTVVIVLLVVILVLLL